MVDEARCEKEHRMAIPLNFPLDWELKLRFSLLPGRPTPCVIKDQKWMRALRINGRLMPVIIEVKGDAEQPKLIIMTSKNSFDKEIERFVFEFHGLKDARDFYDFMDKDDVLRRIKEKLYGFGRAGLMSSTVFEGIIKAIIQQQISLKVAESITANLVERYGEKIGFCGEYLYEFPDAETLANLSLEELRRCGLSWRKAMYVREFSKSVLNGFNPEDLRNKDRGEIMETLTTFKGIGRWTAELVIVASIGMNAIPADDLGVRKAISRFYFNGKIQPAEIIRKFAEKRFGKFMRDCLVYLLMAYRMGLE